MDLNLFVFFTLFGFLCLILSRITRYTGLGFGMGIIATLVFVLIGLMIGTGELITSTVYTDSPQVVPLNLGLSADNILIIYLSLALISVFVGFD